MTPDPPLTKVDKPAQDKGVSNLSCIAEGEGKTNDLGTLTKPGNPLPALTRKKSLASLRNRIPSDNGGHGSTGDKARNGPVQSIVQESRARPRPLSVSGIPSPSPRSSSTSHARRDKYEGLIPDTTGHRKTTSVRSVSANFEKMSGESKPVGPSVPRAIFLPRESSRRVLQEAPKPRKEIPIPEIKDALSVPRKRLPSKDTSTARDGTAPDIRPTNKESNSPSHRRQSSKDTVIPSHTRKLSKDNKQPIHKIPLKAKSSKELSVSPHSIVPTISKEHLRTQRSRDFSPTLSTPTSSPKSSRGRYHQTTSNPSTGISMDAPPEQTRLLQLLHLIPLSEKALATYESSADEQLSARYEALQLRFERIQRQDHAQTLAERVATLREWSDAHIRSLSNLLVDWESLTIDFRAFCKRLANSLKPINKSVLEERGSFPPPEGILTEKYTALFRFFLNSAFRGLTVDRLFSRLHDLEIVLVGLPATKGWPGQVIDEMRVNLPLLKREVEMAVTVAGLRWRREVLQVEARRMDVVKRLSLVKPTSDSVICAWRE